jgi:hypothetical protein
MSTSFDLANAFAIKQDQLHGELRGAEAVSHPGDKGDISEDAWATLLTGLLPARYQVSKATVVDCRGGKSDAIDLVIHDRHFSPLVFQQGGVMYVPAESVYAVFECKPSLDKAYVGYAGDKAASVRALHRTSAPIVHAGGTIATPKPPPQILAGLLTTRSDWSPAFGKSFTEQLVTVGDRRLDLGCVVAEGAWEVPADPIIAVTIAKQERGLVFFAMRLLARLQQIGTIPAMDYDAWSAPLQS